MKFLTRSIALLMAAILCILPVCATEAATETEYFTEWSEGLDAIMAAYIEENGLNERNFSIGYLYTGTGEYWYYNEEKLLIGGSLYKLPLNMRVTEKVLAGELSWDDYVKGVPLPEAQYQSIVHSNNPISMAMQRYLVGTDYGYYDTYRTDIAKYSGTFLEDIPAEYYMGNYFSSEFMLNTLVYLYENSDTFDTILGYMKEASPGSYFRLYQGEYEIAHKYGSKDDSLNDAGVVYTPNPFLMVVFTDGVPNSEHILGDLCRLMTEYTLELDAKYEQQRLDEIAAAAARAEAVEQQQAALAAEARIEAQWNALTEQLQAIVTEIVGSAAISSLQLTMP